MPKLNVAPIANAPRAVTTDAASVRGSGIGAAFATAGETVTELAKLADSVQMSRADKAAVDFDTDLSLAVEDITSRPNEAYKWEEQFDEIESTMRAQHRQTPFMNGGHFDAQTNLRRKQRLVGLRNEQNAQILKLGTTAWEETIFAAQERFARGGTQERNIQEGEFDRMLREGVAAGYISPEAAPAMRREMTHDAIAGAISFEITSNPYAAQRTFQLFGGELPAGQRGVLEKEIKSAINAEVKSSWQAEVRAEQAADDAQTARQEDNSLTLTRIAATSVLTTAMVDELVAPNADGYGLSASEATRLYKIAAGNGRILPSGDSQRDEVVRLSNMARNVPKFEVPVGSTFDNERTLSFKAGRISDTFWKELGEDRMKFILGPALSSLDDFARGLTFSGLSQAQALLESRFDLIQWFINHPEASPEDTEAQMKNIIRDHDGHGRAEFMQLSIPPYFKDRDSKLIATPQNYAALIRKEMDLGRISLQQGASDEKYILERFNRDNQDAAVGGVTKAPTNDSIRK